MKNRSVQVIFAGVLAACPLLAADAELIGCTPEVKAKSVKETRREITVGIVGEDLPRCYRDGKPDVEGVIAYWTRAMDGIASASAAIRLRMGVMPWQKGMNPTCS